jgi:hypothetical protein
MHASGQIHALALLPHAEIIDKHRTGGSVALCVIIKNVVVKR